jgi:hypothetical protein
MTNQPDPGAVKRQAEPHEDDVCVHRIEVEFAIPVYIPQAAMRELDGLLSSVIRMKMNQLEGHAHWVSGYGSKPLWSQADALFLGKTPADDMPERGEPTFDESVYHIETSCIPRGPK